MAVHWSENETRKLISGLKEKPELWNVCDIRYLNREKKDDAARALLLDLKLNFPEAKNKTAKDVRIKIEHIKSQYRKERGPTGQGKPTGTGADAGKNPSAGAFDDLDFLKPLLEFSPKCSNAAKTSSIDTSGTTPTMSSQGARKRKQLLNIGIKEDSATVVPNRGNFEFLGEEVVRSLNAFKTERAKRETIVIIQNVLREGTTKDKFYMAVPGADISTTELECALAETGLPNFV